MNKIRKGDEVVVITGRDKGRRGTVIRVLGDKVLVENVNMVKRHTRPNPQKGTQGGIVEKEAALHISNVQLWNPVARKGTGFLFDHFTPEGLRWALDYSLNAFQDREAWKELQKNGM